MDGREIRSSHLYALCTWSREARAQVIHDFLFLKSELKGCSISWMEGGSDRPTYALCTWSREATAQVIHDFLIFLRVSEGRSFHVNALCTWSQEARAQVIHDFLIFLRVSWRVIAFHGWEGDQIVPRKCPLYMMPGSKSPGNPWFSLATQ